MPVTAPTGFVEFQRAYGDPNTNESVNIGSKLRTTDSSPGEVVVRESNCSLVSTKQKTVKGQVQYLPQAAVTGVVRLPVKNPNPNLVAKSETFDEFIGILTSSLLTGNWGEGKVVGPGDELEFLGQTFVHATKEDTIGYRRRYVNVVPGKKQLETIRLFGTLSKDVPATPGPIAFPAGTIDGSFRIAASGYVKNTTGKGQDVVTDSEIAAIITRMISMLKPFSLKAPQGTTPTTFEFNDGGYASFYDGAVPDENSIKAIA